MAQAGQGSGLEWPDIPDDVVVSEVCLKCGGPGPLNHVVNKRGGRVVLDGHFCSKCITWASAQFTA